MEVQNMAFYNSMVKIAPERYGWCDAGYSAVSYIKEAGIQVDNICAISHPELYQFLLNREKITVTIPENMNQNNIVLADSYNDMLIDMGYGCYQLDDNEYIYLSGELESIY